MIKNQLSGSYFRIVGFKKNSFWPYNGLSQHFSYYISHGPTSCPMLRVICIKDSFSLTCFRAHHLIFEDCLWSLYDLNPSSKENWREGGLRSPKFSTAKLKCADVLCKRLLLKSYFSKMFPSEQDCRCHKTRVKEVLCFKMYRLQWLVPNANTKINLITLS